MYHKIFLFSLGSLCALTSQAAELNSVGQMMPMIHINIDFNSFNDELSVHVDSGVPQMQPLSVASPGDSFNPAAPWYTTLDPSQEGLAWTRRYGFVATNDPAPEGLSFWVDLDVTTMGLEAYFTRTEPDMFTPIFGTDGSSTLWEFPNTMIHPVFAGDPTVASYVLTGTIYVGDSEGVAAAGYNSAAFTLNFTSVPEPGVYALAVGLLALVPLLVRCRKGKAGARA